MLSNSPDRLLFQFTPPRGGDRELQTNDRFLRMFQFTPPRGGDKTPLSCNTRIQ